LRLFFSLPLPEEARAQLAPALAALRAPGLSCARAEQLHFTLAFLGELRSAEAALVAGAAVERHAAFELALGGAGAFPSGRRPRVLWLGVQEGASELVALARTLSDALHAAGLALDARPFRPHLTLARVKPGGERAAAGAMESAAAAAVRFRATHVELVQSHLGSSGARHETLRRFDLS
jgi:2'-5' RNA ligase